MPAPDRNKSVDSAPLIGAAPMAGATLPPLDPQSPDFAALSAFGQRLTAIAADAIRPYFRQRLVVENKNAEKGLAGFDPVTAADKAAEQAIRAAIAGAYPDHAIEGEEYGLTGVSPWRWIIDPIDGTRAFMMGMLSWGVLIGLVRDDRPVFGIMAQPHTGELFWNDNTAAWMRNPDGDTVSLKTRACPAIDNAVLACTDPSMFRGAADRAAYDRIAAEVKLARFGGDCYAYAMLAAGCIDLVIESNLQSYDVAALIPIVEKAGGVMTTWDGGPALAGGRILAAGDARLHAAAMTMLAM